MCVIKGFICENLLIECLTDQKEEVRVELSREETLIMALFNEAHISISLHAVGAFLDEELLKLFLVPRCCQLISLGHLQGLPDHFLIVSQRVLGILCLLDGSDGGSVIEFHVLLRVVDIDGTGLDWHQVSTQHHLAEAIVIHMLQTCLLFGAVNIDPLVLFVQLSVYFCPHMLRGQLYMVERLLLPRVL